MMARRERDKARCDWCGKTIYKSPSERRKYDNQFCSIDCRDKYLRHKGNKEKIMRMEQIISILELKGRTTINSLNSRLDYSKDTIRESLRKLQDQNIVEKNKDGHIYWYKSKGD